MKDMRRRRVNQSKCNTLTDQCVLPKEILGRVHKWRRLFTIAGTICILAVNGKENIILHAQEITEDGVVEIQVEEELSEESNEFMESEENCEEGMISEESEESTMVGDDFIKKEETESSCVEGLEDATESEIVEVEDVEYTQETDDIIVLEQVSNTINKLSEKKSSMTVTRYATDTEYDITDNLVVTFADNVTGEENISLDEYVLWESTNTNIATISDEGVVTCLKSGSVSIKATSKENNKKTVKFTLKIVQAVTGIDISGSSVTAVSKSNTYKAVVEPANATNKKVVWGVEPAGQGVTVTAAGVVKVTKGCTLKSCKIIATAADGKGAVSSYEMKINEYPVSSLKLMRDGENLSQRTKTLFRVKSVETTPTELIPDINITYKGEGEVTECPYVFTSSKPEIATVDANGVVKVTGNETGSTDIKCTVMDGTKNANGGRLSVSYTVKVVNPASSLELAYPGTRSKYVANGKTIKLTPVFGTEYGTLSSKKLKWTSSDTARAKVDSTGLVTMKCELYNPVTITATAADGSNVSASITLYGATPVNNISMGGISYIKASSKYTLQIGKDTGKFKLPLIFNEPDSGTAEEICVCPNVMVTSSAPDILSVVQVGNNIEFVPLADSQGQKVKVTVKSMDGKGVSHTWYFIVTG